MVQFKQFCGRKSIDLKKAMVVARSPRLLARVKANGQDESPNGLIHPACSTH
jgi:hypothetical protein